VTQSSFPNKGIAVLKDSKVVIAIALAAVTILSSDQLSSAQTAATVSGVYAVNAIGTNNVLDPQVASNPNVDGLLIRPAWSTLEPAEGVFSWKWTDRIIRLAAAAGKKVSIGIGAGVQTPSWVYADGAQSFKFIWDQGGWGPPVCSIATIPVPWDPVFQTKWAGLISAFAAHYASNPAVTSIKLTGINSETLETALPLSNNKLITYKATSCHSYNDPANWQAAGYTRLKVENAWAEIEQDFHAGFPTTPLQAMMVSGFPPIDNNGLLIPKQWQDTQLPTDLANMGLADSVTQFVLQNNGLSSTWIWPVEANYASQIATGYQMVAALGSKLQSAINLALSAKADYLEIYASDIDSQPQVIATTRQALP